MPRKFIKKKETPALEKEIKEVKTEAVVDPQAASEAPTKKGFLRFSKQSFIYIIVVVILLAAAGASALFYFKYQEALKLSQNIAGNSVDDEVQKLIELVGKVAELP